MSYDRSDPTLVYTLPFQLTKKIHRSVPDSLQPETKENREAAKGKIVVITGGGTGIGAATAKVWVRAGAAGVVIAGRRQEKLDATVQELEQLKKGETMIFGVATDVKQETSVDNLYEQVNKRFGRPADVVFANAGAVGPIKPFTEETVANWWNIYEINVLGTHNTVRSWIKSQPDPTKPVGTVININSGIAGLIMPGVSAYSTSKSAVHRYMEYVAAEFPSLRAFTLLPGIVATDIGTDDGLVQYAKDEGEQTGALGLYLASPRGDWLKGSLTSINWDLEEMEAHKAEVADVYTSSAVESSTRSVFQNISKSLPVYKKRAPNPIAQPTTQPLATANHQQPSQEQQTSKSGAGLPQQAAFGDPSYPSLPQSGWSSSDAGNHGPGSTAPLDESQAGSPAHSQHSEGDSTSSESDSVVSFGKKDWSRYSDSEIPDLLIASFGVPFTDSGAPVQWPAAVFSMYHRAGNDALIHKDAIAIPITDSRPLDQIIREDRWDGPKRLIVSFWLDEPLKVARWAAEDDVVHRDVDQCIATLRPLLADWDIGFISEQEDEFEAWFNQTSPTRNMQLLAKLIIFAKSAGYEPVEGASGQDRQNRWRQGPKFSVVRFQECEV